jgi:hypothetical protein
MILAFAAVIAAGLPSSALRRDGGGDVIMQKGDGRRWRLHAARRLDEILGQRAHVEGVHGHTEGLKVVGIVLC